MNINAPAPFPWSLLERHASLSGIAATWRGLLGEHLAAFGAAYLQKLAEPAKGVFCERCYCTHEVIHETPEIIAALAASMTPTAMLAAGNEEIPPSRSPSPSERGHSCPQQRDKDQTGGESEPCRTSNAAAD